jgi:hypothetical protein
MGGKKRGTRLSDSESGIFMDKLVDKALAHVCGTWTAASGFRGVGTYRQFLA